MDQRAWAIFAQDKWRVNQNLTLNLGLRYDLEFTPVDNSANPYFADDPDAYPLDKNNFSPRVGATYTWDEGRSLLRSGWGLFYDKVNFAMVVDFDPERHLLGLLRRAVPGRPHRSRPARRPDADQPDAGQRSGGEPRPPQPALSAGRGDTEHRRRVARQSRPDHAEHPAGEPRLPAAARDADLDCRRLRAHLRPRPVHDREPQPRGADHHRRPDRRSSASIRTS